MVAPPRTGARIESPMRLRALLVMLAAAGLLGMNVGGIPLAENSRGFLVVVSIVIVFTIVITWVYVRRANSEFDDLAEAVAKGVLK